MRFKQKSLEVMYSGTITRKITRDEFQIIFLRKKTESNHFVFPDTINISDVNINDILRKLPKPVTIGEQVYLNLS